MHYNDEQFSKNSRATGQISCISFLYFFCPWLVPSLPCSSVAMMKSSSNHDGHLFAVVVYTGQFVCMEHQGLDSAGESVLGSVIQSQVQSLGCSVEVCSSMCTLGEGVPPRCVVL